MYLMSKLLIIRKAHGCVIGETTAEIIKKEVGMAVKPMAKP
jgi:actin-like ATPase involved in cell morphogenesis